MDDHGSGSLITWTLSRLIMKLRFSISFLLALTAIAGILASQYEHYHECGVATQTVECESGTAILAFGTRKHKSNPILDQLEFVVLVTSSDEYPGTATIQEIPSSGYDSAVLKIGDIEIVLPSNRQLHEVSDGKHRAFNEKIDLETFARYNRLPKKRFSIKSLIDFAAQQRNGG